MYNAPARLVTRAGLGVRAPSVDLAAPFNWMHLCGGPAPEPHLASPDLGPWRDKFL